MKATVMTIVSTDEDGQISTTELIAAAHLLKMSMQDRESSQGPNAYPQNRTGRGAYPSNRGSGGSMYYNKLIDEVVMIDKDRYEGFSMNAKSFSPSSVNSNDKSASPSDGPPEGVPSMVWDMIKNLPEEQRNQAIQSLRARGQGSPRGGPPAGAFGQQAQSEVKFVKTKKTGKKDGMRFTTWQKLEGDEKSEFDVVKWNDIRNRGTVEELLIGLSDLFEKMRKSALGNSGFGGGNDNMFDDIKKLDGLPLQGRTYRYNQLVGQFSVEDISEKDVPESHLKPDPRIPVTKMEDQMKRMGSQSENLFNQMSQGNPHRGSDINHEELRRMQEERQRNQNRRNNTGPASIESTTEGAANDSANSRNR